MNDRTSRLQGSTGTPTLFGPPKEALRLRQRYSPDNTVTFYEGDCLKLLASMPSKIAQLVVTSPPYNIGKKYERRLKLPQYLQQQRTVINECIRVLRPTGSICWQVGNYTDKGAIIPLDIALYPIFADAGLKMRNRIVWHFEHGLHCSRRLSGRYELILWFTKSDDYVFNLDPLRIPQKYPGKKYFKGPKAGQYSCNPKGKNPGDLWVIPNVKHNHVEKTIHPCQFPIELIERLVLGMTNKDDLVLDPFMGVGTTAVAAIRHGRRAAGAEVDSEYCALARDRIGLEWRGILPSRPMNRPVYEPSGNESVARNPFTIGAKTSGRKRSTTRNERSTKR